MGDSLGWRNLFNEAMSRTVFREVVMSALSLGALQDLGYQVKPSFEATSLGQLKVMSEFLGIGRDFSLSNEDFPVRWMEMTESPQPSASPSSTEIVGEVSNSEWVSLGVVAGFIGVLVIIVVLVHRNQRDSAQGPMVKGNTTLQSDLQVLKSKGSRVRTSQTKDEDLAIA